MPTVIVNRALLFKEIGKTFTDDEFDELCFQFGIELDDVTSEQKMAANESNVIDNNLSNETLYKIEVGANRYDLLCLEGLAQSLKTFLSIETPPRFTVNPTKEPLKLIVEDSVKNVRPFACSAILKDISFTEDSLKSFIELQDKLHQNICRQRTLVTMGTHDLDTVKGPIYFRAQPPKDIVFKALKQTEIMDANSLMEVLKNDQKLKKYCHLLDGQELFPVLVDSNGIIMALPPMINSEHSKITVNTKNVFIDVTAFDETKANVVLNILVTMFSTYCKNKFTVEPVEVVDYNGKSEVYPKLEYVNFTADLEYLARISGTGLLDEKTVIGLLDRMSLHCTPGKQGQIEVSVPPTRSDVLHACDIAEDLAIAYGYDNISKITPPTICDGYQQPINKLTELIRQEMAMTGYVEALTFALVSKEDSILKMGYELNDKLSSHVQILKSKTVEFELVRTSLIPGLLKTIEKNQMNPMPLKLFEISDVCLIDEQSETGSRNRRYLSFAYANYNHSGFEIIQGVIDHLFESKFGLEYNSDNGYKIIPSDDIRFFKDRQANLLVRGKNVGIFGIITPEVSKKFGKLMFPISLAEIDIEYLFELIISGELLGSKERK